MFVRKSQQILGEYLHRNEEKMSFASLTYSLSLSSISSSSWIVVFLVAQATGGKLTAVEFLEIVGLGIVANCIRLFID